MATEVTRRRFLQGLALMSGAAALAACAPKATPAPAPAAPKAEEKPAQPTAAPPKGGGYTQRGSLL